MPSNTVMKCSWERDHVYLIQFPRARAIPSPSAFSLKLETWLRVANIPFTNISNNFTKKSAKGQVPFIELNGRQIADSNFIVEYLMKHFNKEYMEGATTALEKAYARAFHDLVEHSLSWVIPWDRSNDMKWIASTDKGFGGHMGAMQKLMMENFFVGRLQSGLKKTTQAVGIARHSPDEVVVLAKKDLDALSAFLGSKKFFFGDQASTLDCSVFGIVAQFMFAPLYRPDIKTYIENNCSNLASHINRMKETYWPDWDEACMKLSLDTKRS